MFIITTFLYILLALFVFGVMIFLHELGHFTAARLSGVTIYEFAIGMGPKIFSWKSKKYDTKYSLRLLPIGGYVSMAGEDGECEDENAFNKKPKWKRFLILFAGPAMNIILGIVLTLTTLVCQTFINKTDDHYGLLLSNTIHSFRENSISNDYGLMEGDKIVKVGKTPIHTGNELYYEVMYQGNKAVDITVVRDGEKKVIEDVKFGIQKEQGMEFGSADFVVYGENPHIGNLLKHTFFISCSNIKMVWDGLSMLFTGRAGVDALSGPIGITEQMGEVAGMGIVSFLSFVAVITINLGVMNLLPIPALDGGRLLFLAIEAITRKKINPKVESTINAVGLIILFALMIFITFKDIIKLF